MTSTTEAPPPETYTRMTWEEALGCHRLLGLTHTLLALEEPTERLADQVRWVIVDLVPTELLPEARALLEQLQVWHDEERASPQGATRLHLQLAAEKVHRMYTYWFMTTGGPSMERLIQTTASKKRNASR